MSEIRKGREGKKEGESDREILLRLLQLDQRTLETVTAARVALRALQSGASVDVAAIVENLLSENDKFRILNPALSQYLLQYQK